MKKRIVNAFVLLSALAMVSCGNKTGGNIDGIDSDSLFVDTVLAETPVVKELKTEMLTSRKKLGCWTWSAQIEYPTDGNPELVKNIRTSIERWLSDKCDFKGNHDDGQAVLDYYGSQFIKGINYDDYADLPNEIKCENNIEVKRQYEDSDYITFSVMIYVYSGGAHGSTISFGSTFSKSTGQPLGWNTLVKKKLTPSLRKYQIAGLKEYLEVKTDEDLMGALMLQEGVTLDNLPLPETDPWVQADGLHFIYQQYEIACYAAGMPGFVIPKSRMRDFIISK